MGNLWDALLSIIYPSFCPICSSSLAQPSKSPVCSNCWENVNLIEPPFCATCGLPLSIDPNAAASIELLCANCRKGKSPFSKARALGIYEYELRDIILLLKFKGKKSLAKELASMAYARIKESAITEGVDGIIPVPLYWRRKRERGFNQAELLAAHLSSSLGIELLTDYLRRIRNTPPQSQVNPKERAKNVRGAFKVREPWWRIIIGLLQIAILRLKRKRLKKWKLSTPTHYLKRKTVLLIDDIFTTGATVSECARALKKAGAKEVRVFTIARA